YPDVSWLVIAPCSCTSRCHTSSARRRSYFPCCCCCSLSSSIASISSSHLPTAGGVGSAGGVDTAGALLESAALLVLGFLPSDGRAGKSSVPRDGAAALAG